MSHTVTLSELEEHMSETKVLFAACSKHGGKHLKFDAVGNYYVYHKGSEILKTGHRKDAIEAYNDLP